MGATGPPPHALVTNDVLALKAGTGCYAALLTPQGRMIADMRVIEVGDRLLLDVSPAVAPALSARLEQLIFSEDVRVTDATGALGEVGLHGPESAAVIQRSMGVEAARLVSLSQDRTYAPEPAMPRWSSSETICSERWDSTSTSIGTQQQSCTPRYSGMALWPAARRLQRCCVSKMAARYSAPI